ncbi:hypothetical protein C5C31_11825 [Rathayibacter rathayi]|uniref:DUF8094 domain-containing protein n=1 Tax=Rathayibacter rathayi TaxID=33887 RepID=A0ABD6W6P2_RATRA|nr:hypothetical protein [Rathayibacter rathayi]AZZ48914.1 hypothetical protein C1O28_06670 [Rathayibacter rathayi]MWV74013.1 hypothetical protein [Rathayibacter rathayi NCPPB 2980 = VKM Ac-1601]PPF11707.1 hypothetical protein C5C04_11880 [Rathayibacter rathayi]PPF24968.1 hypothetical protein C5C34_03310 [Rathayibacter rathayi]PPF46281.1 hypothetical protein C5C08_12010 [Rathayibacter rathayi]
MRFVFAIIATVIAAAMIVLGIGQRTVWAPPESITAQTALDSSAPYAVIDGSTLGANPGRQTITVEGSGDLVVAYAPTSDVLGWVGRSSYDAVGYERVGDTLTAAQETGRRVRLSSDVETADAAVVDPRGSDLWLEQFEGNGSVTLALDVPEDVSILVATDGTAPAADSVRVTWPVDTATPLAGPLLLGGAVFLLLGLILYIWAFVHLRRQHGPRRKGPQGRIPRGARRPRPRAGIQASVATPTRRRAALVLPMVLGTTVLLSGCSSDYWPDLAAGPSEVPIATATPTAGAEPVAAEPTPVVTTQQAEAIVAAVAGVASRADEARDASILAERFQGEALTERTTNYEVTAKGGTIAPPQSIPASPVSLVLPQDTETWPRLVTAVVQNSADSTQAPIALMLSQASPRVDYKVNYAISLEANARIPDVAPVTVGTSIVAPDSRLMKLAPQTVGSAYADVLANGDASQYAGLFVADGDTLRGQVGIDKKNADRQALPDTASIEFSNAAGTSPTIALATNNSGALVAASIAESSTVRPTAEGSTVSTSGASQTLLGTDKSTTGIKTTYGYQLLFYVPSVGSEEKIVMLGWSQGLVSVVQLP